MAAAARPHLNATAPASSWQNGVTSGLLSLLGRHEKVGKQVDFGPEPVKSHFSAEVTVGKDIDPSKITPGWDAERPGWEWGREAPLSDRSDEY